MLIDFHTHCFPEKIASKAISTLAKSGGLVPNTDGTPEGLLKVMDEESVDISVVLNIATNERQQKSVNDFAASIKGKRLIPFGSVYPTAPDALDELERIKEMGLLGVKFHPEYQEFYVDDEKMKPIYKKISELGLITVFHAGYDIGYRPPYHCMPEHLEKALSWFSTPVVAAHLGGMTSGDEVLKHLCGKENLYLDTAFCYAHVQKPIFSDILEKHGTDKILFGTDLPWHRASLERALIETMDLNEEEKNKIYYKNAEKLLGLSGL